MTTQNGNFLTEDMINAIVDNELHYVIKHFDKFRDKFRKG